MDAGKAFGDDDLGAEVAWGDRGVFSARALAVVGAADGGVAAAEVAIVCRARRVGVVDAFEGEFGNLGDVGPVGQDPGTCRGDVVGGDVRTRFEQHGCGHVRRERIEGCSVVMLGVFSSRVARASSVSIGAMNIISFTGSCAGSAIGW